MFQGKRPIPAQGTLVFTPQAEYVLRHGDTTMLPSPVTAVLDSEGYVCSPDISMKTRKPLYAMNGTLRPGTRGVMLTATDDPNSLPKNWTWKVDFNLTSMGDKTPYKSFSFALPTDTEVDLTKVTPVPGMSGYSTIEGPKGDSVHFAEEKDPFTIAEPTNGLIVPFNGTLYGYSNGWSELGKVSANPVGLDVAIGNSTIRVAKTAEGLVNLTGVIKNETEETGHLPKEFSPSVELTLPIVSCDGESQGVMTVTPTGEVKTPSGDFSVTHTYNPGRS